jgi:ABC-2 type transport system permease protein
MPTRGRIRLPDPKRLSPLEFIRGTRVIVSREMEAYFDAPIAYIYASVFLILSCSTFMNAFFLNGLVDMAPYFEVLPFLLIPFIPAITMRVWAEERAQNTYELLMTLPLQPLQIVLGKYLAAVIFYLIVLAGSLPIVVMLFYLGDPDPGLIVGSYVGSILLGALFLAFGLFVSALTRDQIIAFVLATMLGFILVFTGHPRVVEVIDGLLPAMGIGTLLYDAISIMPHYNAFNQGIIGFSHTAYFILMSVFFIWMNEISLKRNKY